jgi:hypothetical protein
VVNGLLYVAGGFNGSATPLSTLQVYDPATNSWKTLSSMPGARGDLAAGVISGKFYAVGGLGALRGYRATNQAYTP